MDFMALLKSRRSIRGYNAKAVSDDILRLMLEAAQAAPSGGNCQPWHFFVIRDKAVIARIVEQSCKQGWINTAPAVIVVCADIARTAPRYGERGAQLYCIQDTAAAIQNMLLCAEHNGLGTCWCGAFDEAALSGVLKLEADMRPVAIIPVGYYDDKPAPRDRRSIEEISTFI